MERLSEATSPLSYAIIGAMFEVHKQLGGGFLETVYQQALAIEFGLRSIPFDREVPLPITYKGVRLATVYRADFIGDQQVLVELKAQTTLSGADEAQVINYLKATGCRLALLGNFGRTSMEFRRFVMTSRLNVDDVEIETL